MSQDRETATSPAHVVEVWARRVGESPVDAPEWLRRGWVTEPDVTRAGLFHREADRARSLVASRLLREAAIDWRLRNGIALRGALDVSRQCPDCGEPHGRPVVAGGPHVSVSHAEEDVLVALCASSEVGVDVEPLSRAADAHGLGALLGAAALGATSTPLGALRQWVRVEAGLKATGEGLRREPSDWVVVGPTTGRGVLEDSQHGRQRGFCDLDLPGAVAAVATATGYPGTLSLRGGLTGPCG